jgi:hypothetical protein
MVLADSHGIPRVPRYSGTGPTSRSPFRLRGCHPLWPKFPQRSTRVAIGNSSALRPNRPYNPTVQARWFGLFRVRSPLLAESLLFSVPAGTEMVHFPALPSLTYGFSQGYPGMTPGGFPHSEISGSKPVCGSPKLIAAYHVLHRLLAPRHSPYALSSLTITWNSGGGCPHPQFRVSKHCVLWSVKLPFAGYSVVKEHPTLARRAGEARLSRLAHP